MSVDQTKKPSAIASREDVSLKKSPNILPSGVAKLSGLSGVRLRYFRLRCKDIERTMEFYQAIGMVIACRFETETSVQFQMGYKTEDLDLNDGRVDLLFDYAKDEQIRNVELQQGPEEMKDYLVIYVHIIKRLVSRLEKLGFTPILDIHTYQDVQFAILQDPNGVEVRLMELTDNHLSDESIKGQWFARIAYYVYNPPCPILAAINYFEGFFSASMIFPSKSDKINQSTGPGAQQSDMLKGFARFGGASIVGGGISGALASGNSGYSDIGKKKEEAKLMQKEGFMVVDEEDAVTGLTRTLYYWLASSPRDKAACLCLTQKAPERKIGQPPIAPMSTRALLGLGFQVPSVEEATAQIVRELGTAINIVIKCLSIEAALRILSRFYDHTGHLQMDIFSTFDPDKDASKQRRPMTPPIEPMINYDALGGLRPVLSMGAIISVQGSKTSVKKKRGAAAKKMDKFELLSPSEDLEDRIKRTKAEITALKAAEKMRRHSL